MKLEKNKYQTTEKILDLLKECSDSSVYEYENSRMIYTKKDISKFYKNKIDLALNEYCDKIRKYPIDDGNSKFHGSVNIQSTHDQEIRSRQIELYLFLVRNIKYILNKCADAAYNLIKKIKIIHILIPI